MKVHWFFSKQKKAEQKKKDTEEELEEEETMTGKKITRDWNKDKKQKYYSHKKYSYKIDTEGNRYFT